MRFKIDWASLIAEVNLQFLLCFTSCLRAILREQAPGRLILILEGRFNGGLFALPVCGAYIWRGLFSEFYGSYCLSFKRPFISLFVHLKGTQNKQHCCSNGAVH